MGLDKESVSIGWALKQAKKFYKEDTYLHSLRVMQYIADNDIISAEYKEDCLALAIMHDLIEDTDYIPVGVGENFEKALLLLSKPQGMSYIDYIKRFESHRGFNYGECAWWVKIADMKDHLAQVDTLTDRLKEKYLKALPYLL